MTEHTQWNQWDIVSSVGLTALIVAAGRAVDTHRPDGLIHDQWAEHFVAAAHPPVPLPVRPEPPRDDSEEEAWQMMSGYMGVRTRWFDTVLLAAANGVETPGAAGTAAAHGGVRQVVLLAAGLDCRAYRLPWPDGTRVYEIDQAAVLRFKEDVLDERRADPTCDRRPVAVDLRDDWSTALLAAGFDPEQPSTWLAEGLLPYLPPEAETALLETVDRLSAPGSTLTIENFTNLSEQVLDPPFRRLCAKFGVDLPGLLHHDDREAAERWLTGRGWEVETTRAADAAADYGRVLDPLTERLNAKTEFLVASC